MVMSRKKSDFFKYSGSVASRQIGDETLLVPIDKKSGQKHSIYTLNSTASFLWSLLQTEKSVEELVIAVTTEFNIDQEIAATDTVVFIDDLLDFNAIMKVNDHI